MTTFARPLGASSWLFLFLLALVIPASDIQAQPPNVGFVSYIDLPDDSQASVDKVVVQPDGRILIAGRFSQIQDYPRAGLARIHTSGSIDLSFNPARSGMFALQLDGKIIVANGTEITRLNSDGSLDGTFTAIPIAKTGGSVRIRDVTIAADGKTYIVGDFDQVAGQTRNDLARLNADGTFDATLGDVATGFFGNFSANLAAVVVQPDGKIVVGGGFTGIAGVARRMLARLNSNGTIDNTFTHNLTSNTDEVRQILLVADGKMLVSGTVEYGATAFTPVRQGLFRIFSDGSLDQAFAAPSSMRVGFNGGPCHPAPASEIYCTGAIPGRPENSSGFLVRKLSATGQDTTTGHSETATDNVYGMAVQGDGKILVGGDFGVPPGRDPSQPHAYFMMPRTLTRLTLVSQGASQFTWDRPRQTRYDFTGDARADITIFRPSEGVWYTEVAGGGYLTTNWGIAGDKPIAADFDGDATSDMAVWRASEGRWYIINSANFTIDVRQWGIDGDVPVAADYNGDRKSDVMIFRPSDASWYMISSIDLSIHTFQFGAPGDKPFAVDFDNDLRADLTVFHPADGKWSVRRSTFPQGQQLYERVWGTATDIPVPGAWVNAPQMDFAFYRPSTGSWHISSYINPVSTGLVNWGQPGDIPVPADYNGGQGFTDFAVYRPSNNTWYIYFNFDNGIRERQFGIAGDIPVQAHP